MPRTTTVELLALDLDGTVIGPSLEITPAVQDAVARAIAAGVHVTIVTGRMFVAARPYARQLRLNGPVICYQGAAIFDAESGGKLRETPLPAEVTMAVTKQALADGMHVQLYRDDRFYVQSLNRFAEIYANIARVRPVLVDSLVHAFAGSGSTKIVIVDTPERAAAYTQKLRDFCGPRAYVTRSQADFVEVINPQVDKGEALRWVAAAAGLSLASAVAIGDSWNDAPLLDAVAFGVAMGSAPAELIARAKAVVGAVERDGVAEAIAKYVVQ